MFLIVLLILEEELNYKSIIHKEWKEKKERGYKSKKWKRTNQKALRPKGEKIENWKSLIIHLR